MNWPGCRAVNMSTHSGLTVCDLCVCVVGRGGLEMTNPVGFIMSLSDKASCLS